MAQNLTEITAVRTATEAVIADYLDENIAHAKVVGPSYVALWEALASLLRVGGKRYRPYLTVMAYESFGGDDTAAIIPVAAAQELLHVSLLIHDDIIDRDQVRYGILNVVGRYYNEHYAAIVPADDDRMHYAQSAAILGGDLLLSGAFGLIAQSGLDPAAVRAAQRFLHEGLFDVAGGELIDTEAAFRPFAEVDALTVARYKTAGYSFICPLLTGAHLAGADEQSQAVLRECAIALGIGFQLADDVLGVFGDSARTGKSTDGDIREGKHTLLAEYTLQRLTDPQRETFLSIFGNRTTTAADIATVRQLMQQCGAREAVQAAIANYAQQARDALAQLQLPAAAQERFAAMIRLATEREA